MRSIAPSIKINQHDGPNGQGFGQGIHCDTPCYSLRTESWTRDVCVHTNHCLIHTQAGTAVLSFDEVMDCRRPCQSINAPK